jgi:hypothetical protein
MFMPPTQVISPLLTSDANVFILIIKHSLMCEYV